MNIMKIMWCPFRKIHVFFLSQDLLVLQIILNHPIKPYIVSLYIKNNYFWNKIYKLLYLSSLFITWQYQFEKSPSPYLSFFNQPFQFATFHFLIKTWQLRRKIIIILPKEYMNIVSLVVNPSIPWLIFFL